MPVEFIPQVGPEISNITQCIGGGNIQIELGPSFYPTGSRNLTNLDIPSPSPVSIRENININGNNQNNCSLINRVMQAQLIISQESSINNLNAFDQAHLYYGDGQSSIITDYVPPSYNVSSQTLNNTLNLSSNDQTYNVYESAYLLSDTMLHRGTNILSSISLIPSSSGDSSYISQVNVLELATEPHKWVIINGNTNHQDWTYTYSDLPNPLEYAVFTEDHWWIYDFGETNKQVVGKIDISFVYTDLHRHSHIEVWGSNDPTIFSTDSGNIENVVGEQWEFIKALNTVSFPSDGILSNSLFNNTPYRWYKLNFKSDGFEDNEMHIQNVNLYGSTLSSINEVKMSDFYGLFLLDTVPNPAPIYNSGYRMVTSSADNSPQLNIGGGSLS